MTNTNAGLVEVINAASNRVTGTLGVGQMPWQLVLAPKGGTLYVADADSDAVSLISTSTGHVTSTISLAGDPDTLALTPDGSQLWVGGLWYFPLGPHPLTGRRAVCGRIGPGGVSPWRRRAEGGYEHEPSRCAGDLRCYR